MALQWRRRQKSFKSTGNFLPSERSISISEVLVLGSRAVTDSAHVNVLKLLREPVRRKRPEAWTDSTWMLHHDNAPAQASLLIREFFTKHETTVVPQTPYSPYLVPADFFLFPKLRSALEGRRFQTVEEIEENSIKEILAIRQNTFQDAFQNWKDVGRGVWRVEGSTLKETSLIKL